MIFYDTSALLIMLENAFKEPLVISDITLKELEQIKSSKLKDDETKYKARQLAHLIDKNLDKIEIMSGYFQIDRSNDLGIIQGARSYAASHPDIQFMTDDVLCKLLAFEAGLNVIDVPSLDDTYTGYHVVQINSDEELAGLYENLFSGDCKLDFPLYTNEYLLIKDLTGKEIDCYRFTGENFEQVSQYKKLETSMFGKIVAKDWYQAMAIDSLKSNQFTLLRGSAGTAKSLLSLAYLFSALEKHKIDRIIVFCNTVATVGSARLGLT